MFHSLLRWRVPTLLSCCILLLSACSDSTDPVIPDRPDDPIDPPEPVEVPTIALEVGEVTSYSLTFTARPEHATLCAYMVLTQTSVLPTAKEILAGGGKRSLPIRRA